ncbi:MAG: DUF4159 domain-containing protein [Burkholderiales bacterium]|nr:DUF4159 domain-containing protein [Phycisphaerae bacterium]
MSNSDKLKLDLQPVELTKDVLKGYKIAHLTGVDKFTLSDDQRNVIKDFVAAGGLLVIDACGGFGEFDASVQAELSKIFPAEASQIAEPLKQDHPIYTAGAIPKPQPKYRVYAMQKLGADATRFRLRGLTIGGKLGVVYSPDDLSVGLVGMPIDGIVGYEPEVATTLMRRIITLKNAGGI